MAKTHSEMLADDLAKKREEMKKLFEKAMGEDGKLDVKKLTDDDRAAASVLKAEITEMQQTYDMQVLAENNQKMLEYLNEGPDKKSGFPFPGKFNRAPAHGFDSLEDYKDFNRVAGLKFFGGPQAERKAFGFGKWALAAILGNESAKTYCKDHDLPLALEGKGASEGSNAQGGYLVPSEFMNDIIDLREMFGVFRGYARVVPMGSDKTSFPRRQGGLTAYFIAESGTITESQKNWGRVNLSAEKLAVLTRYSSEIDEDAIIMFGDDLAGEISYAFAEKEDQCGFNGDGTSAYGGMVGVRDAILSLSATRANIAGLIVGAGNLWSELLLTDFQAVVGRLPQYADTANAAWYCHRTFYFTVMEKLALAAGGATAAEVFNTGRTFRFLGYPVRFSQVMPKVEANDHIPVFFGDLRKGVMFGDRRKVTIARSDEKLFDTDEIAIRGTERFHINVHDVGNQSATAADRVPGPIVALATAAS